jgi:hypothetical protein
MNAKVLHLQHQTNPYNFHPRFEQKHNSTIQTQVMAIYVVIDNFKSMKDGQN